EVHVPFPPCPAAAQQEVLPVMREIGDHFRARYSEGRRGISPRPCGDYFMGRLHFAQEHRHGLLAAPNDRPHRNLYDFVRPCTPAHFFPHSMAAVLRLDDRLVEKIRQIIYMPVRTQDHVTASAAIAAIGAAFRYEFLPS